jgi:diaminopimelate epimerase
MQGAANDFIVVDNRAGIFPAEDRTWLARISRRRTGVGCEGTLLIGRSDRADVSMRFFNPDGSEADMCGNGARCLARLAHEIGAAPAAMTIETPAGLLHAQVRADGVRLEMTPPKDWRLDRTLDVSGRALRYSFVNTGVPHVVIEVADLVACDVPAVGRAVRYHPAFAPAGANVNFMRASGPQAIQVRTYERGVEAETLACGTGVTASALIAARLGRVRPPVSVTAASGDVLTEDFDCSPQGAEGVSLRGPAEHVFEGTLDYAPPRTPP